MNRRPPLRRGLLLSVLALGMLSSCDFLDPTRVENPQTTTEDLANAAQPTAALVAGLEAQFARALGATVVVTEVTSDNYSVQGTGYSSEFDTPRGIRPNVVSLNSTGGSYFLLQELRALGDFVIDRIAPEDETATDPDLARAHFYRGMAYLMLGENYVAAPVAPSTQPVAPAELLARAVSDFDRVLSLDGSGAFALPARAALARAHRDLGNAAQARSNAEAALQADPDFVFTQGYDQNSVFNTPNLYLVVRSGQEMQPLPRLDFLDPKYIGEESDIPYAKAEEMLLILAEIDFAEGRSAAAMENVASAVALAKTRPTAVFTDTDPRYSSGLIVRPRDAEIAVRADANSAFRSGLVLGSGLTEGRRGTITVPLISGTSLNADSVRALTDLSRQLHTFWLARQEILFLEGRRMSDLNIRLPITQREIDASPVIDPGTVGTEVFVPEWIPTGSRAMDLFTPFAPYTDSKGVALTTNLITVDVDMNRVLAQNFSQASPLAGQP